MLKDKTVRRYCAVAVRKTDTQTWSLLCTGRQSGIPGRIVLFDTSQITREFLPTLGMGRFVRWSRDRMTAHFWYPEDPQLPAPATDGYDAATIVTDYDPYHLPSGMPEDVTSEVLGREWRRHVMWSHAFTDVGGNMERQEDGSVVNLALGQTTQIADKPVMRA